MIDLAANSGHFRLSSNHERIHNIFKTHPKKKKKYVLESLRKGGSDGVNAGVRFPTVFDIDEATNIFCNRTTSPSNP